MSYGLKRDYEGMEDSKIKEWTPPYKPNYPNVPYNYKNPEKMQFITNTDGNPTIELKSLIKLLFLQ